MSLHRRLTRPELRVMKFIARQQAAGLRFVLLSQRQRRDAVELYHEGLLEIWHRTYSSRDRLAPSMNRSHWCLSASGRRLAQALFQSEFTSLPYAAANDVSRVIASVTQTQGAPS
jgi:hypothetical protein